MEKKSPKTEAEFRALHIELWSWLADNPEAGKKDWPGWSVGDTIHYCFACEYVALLSDKTHCLDSSCNTWCPIKWSAIYGTHCSSIGSEYDAWREMAFHTSHEYGPSTKEVKNTIRRVLAKEIAQMWPAPIKKLTFEGINTFGRPVFKDIESESRYGYSDLCVNLPYEKEKQIPFLKKALADCPDTLVYFGESFDAEPMGTAPGKYKIIWE